MEKVQNVKSIRISSMYSIHEMELDARCHRRSQREMISAEILKEEVKEPYVPGRGARRFISMNAINRDCESEFQEMLG